MRGILGQSHLDIDFTIHDGETVSPEGLMYTSAHEHPSEENADPSFVTRRQVRAYGHAWTLTLFTRPGFEARFATPLDWLVPSLGIGFDLSLFALTWSLLGRREHALDQARAMADQRRESEERFHQLFLHMGQGVVVQQVDGRISQANPAAERILGLSLDEMRGITSMDPRWRIIREDGSEFPGEAQPGMQALHQGKVVNGVVMGVWNPGEEGWHWISVDAYPRHDPATGQLQEVYSVFSDITTQRAANLEVRQARRLLVDVLSAASEVSIIATDPAGLITIFNRGAEHLLGYKAEEMVGRQTPAIIHLAEEVVARGRELSAELGREVQGFRVFVERPEREGAEKREWTYVRKDGTRFPVSLVVTTMRAPGGEVIGYLGIAEDITDRRQAEQDLKLGREQLQEAQRIAGMGNWTLDLQKHHLEWSDEIFRIFEREPSRFGASYQAFLDTVHPEDREMVHQAYNDSLANHQPYDLTHRLLFPDCRIKYVEERCETIYDQAGQPILSRGTVQDITEHKRVEQMKNEFVSTVSHELRTPLTSIAGALGLLAGGALGTLPEQSKPMLDIALKNSQRLTDLINDLLDMEKITAGKLRFDLRVQPLLPLVTQAIEANWPYANQHGVRFELAGGEAAGGVLVRVDSQRLIQVLSNFLSNAAKFSPLDGQVEISVRRMGETVRVAVMDHGPGIPLEFHDRIFQKFSQADSSDTRQKGGTGLGLAITKELAVRMGGRVGFDSIPGQGATFYLDLPMVRAGQDLPPAERP